MADGVQYISELGFDLSPIQKQFEELDRMVVQQGIRLHELAKNNWNLEATLKMRTETGTDAQKQMAVVTLQVNESIKQQAAAFNQANASAETFQNRIDSTNKKLAQEQAQLKLLNAELRQLEKESKGLSNEDIIGKTAPKIEEINRVKSEISGLRKELNATEKEFNQYNAAMNGADVSGFSSGVEKVNAGLKEQAGLVDNVEKKQDGLIAKSAKFSLAYQGVHAAQKAFKETVDTMREVETVMMEIGRVMELNTEQSNRLRDSLFGVSSEMAQTFKDTADISKRFAQAGYQEAAENIEMTRTALLAMNTAELDAVNSTDSMVGILKQWNLEGKDLITVIDKLNYAADNNAITTQDLVDGLLRSSSAAKNAKFSFEETVGALVALKEATGRTGREIGTALNSLVSYTQRGKSQDVFESLGVKIYADEARESLRPLLDVWKDLSDLVKAGGDSVIDTLSKMDGMAELLNQDMAETIGMQKEYNELFAEGLTDVERMDVYNQSGVFRKNYWIALLENFGKIQEVVGEMDNAIGHSSRENARYMETFDAKIKQLVTSLQELAVQAGEAGLLDVAKGATEALTAIAGLTKSAGGLVPVMITLAGVMAIIKRESIASGITSLINPLEKARVQLHLWSVEAKAAGGYVNALKNSFSGGIGLAGAVGIAATAIAAITLGVQAYNRHIEESIIKANELAESFKTQTNEGHNNLKTLEGMVAEIERLSKGVDAFGKNVSLDTSDYERYKKITEDIVKLQPSVTEYREVDGELIANNTLLLDEAIVKQKEYNQSIIDGAEARGTEVFKGLGNQIKKAQQEINDIMAPLKIFKDKSLAATMIGDAEGIAVGAHFTELTKIFDELNISYNDYRETGGFLVADAESLVAKEKELLPALETRLNLQAETKQEIREQIALLKEQLSVIDDAEKSATDYLKTWAKSSGNDEWYGDVAMSGYLTQFEDALSGVYERAGGNAAKAKVETEDLGRAFADLAKAVPSAEIEDLQKQLAEGAITSEEYAAKVEEFKNRLIEASNGSDLYAIVIDVIVASLGGFADAQERVATKTEESTSALSQWASEIDNSDKAVSDLKSSISGLESSMQSLADGKGLTLDATLDLIDKYPQLASAIRFVGDEWYFEADALEMARQAQYNKLVATQTAIVVEQISTNLTKEQSVRLHELVIALTTATDATARQAAMTEFLGFVNANAAGDIELLNAALAKLGAISTAANQTFVSSGASYRGNADAIKKQTDAINENIKATQKKQKEEQEAFNKTKKGLQDELKEFEKTHKAEIDLLKDQKKIAEENHKADIDRLKDRKDAVKDRYDAEIQALRGLKNETSREDARADYVKSREELEREKANEQKKTGREAVERIEEIDKAIAELDEKESRRLRDVDIDDQIRSIEDTRDAELERYELRIKNIENAIKADNTDYENKIKIQEGLIKAEQERVENEIAGLETAWETQKAAFEKTIEGYQAQLDAARNSASGTAGASRQATDAMLQDFGVIIDGVRYTTEQAKAYFEELFNAVIQSSDQAALRVIANNEAQIRSLEGTADKLLEIRQELEWIKNTGAISDYRGVPAGATMLSGALPIRSSHTGSLITGDGLVNLQAGELVVREDISQGLINLIEQTKSTQRIVVRPDIVENLMRSAKMMEEAPNIIKQLISNNNAINNTSNSKNVRIDMRGSQFGAGVGGQRIARDLDSAILELLS